MKRQHNTSLTLLNMGDSLEVMRCYYIERIQELEDRLQALNLLEDARQIVSLCHEVTGTRKALRLLHKYTKTPKS